tara:strand:+ start:65 stop:172 length:108 start_codon:yes stop_codon:yes gene_type:complete
VEVLEQEDLLGMHKVEAVEVLEVLELQQVHIQVLL